jgi:hypothetical protein
VFEENKAFDVFIFEKPNVNRLADGSVTKDGIHMIIGIQVDNILQTMIREKIISKLPEIWDLPLINTWDSVLDEGISKGTTNWQLFGSRKPGNEAYDLTQHFIIDYDKSDGEFMMEERKVSDFDLKNNFSKLSVQNENCPSFKMNPKIMDSYKSQSDKKSVKIKKMSSRTKMNLLVDDDDEDSESDSISLNDIKQASLLVQHSVRSTSTIYLTKDCFSKNCSDILGYHNNGPWVEIKDNIIGFIQHEIEKTDRVFLIDGIFIMEYTKIFKNNVWICACDYIEAIEVVYPYKYMYHLATIDQMIITDKFICRDLLECDIS